MPRWRRDGREFFHRANDGTLMAVALGSGSAASAISGYSAPQPLFAGIPSPGNVPGYTYAAADDGQRFLVAMHLDTEQPPITVVLNWQIALQGRGSD